MQPQIEPQAVKQTIAHLNPAKLDPIVSRLLAKRVTVTAWQVALLGGLDSSPMAGGVYKVFGTAVTAAHITLEWCAVVKILRSPQGMTMPDGTCVTPEMSEDQRGFGFWRREVMVAQSDLSNSLPQGVLAPRFLGIMHISDREYWLWQEYLPADPHWTWDDYREAAFRLGRWQTAYQEAMDYPWLSQEWLAGWVHGPLTRIFGLVESLDGYKHPLLTAYFAAEELASLRQLWGNRQAYLDRLAQLPQTLCHLDAHRGNLSQQGKDLALLDWAFAGQGALGEELAAFIGATLLLDYVPLAEAERLEQVALEGYLAGLRAAGWSGDETIVEEAYRCAMPLRFAPPSLASMLRTVIQPEFGTEWERKTGKPLENILAHRAGLVRFYLSRQYPLLEHVILDRPDGK